MIDDLDDWYQRMAERNESARLHEDGDCADDCGYCRQEDAYDRWRDDQLTEGRKQ